MPERVVVPKLATGFSHLQLMLRRIHVHQNEKLWNGIAGKYWQSTGHRTTGTMGRSIPDSCPGASLVTNETP